MSEQVEDNGVLLDATGETVSVEKAAELHEANKNPEADKKAEDRPQWLPERFKSPEDLAKSYSELEKTLKEKGKLAPDEYVIDDIEAVKVDVQAEDFKQFQELAKSINMTNAQFNAVLKFGTDSGILETGPNYDEEMKALGSDKDEILDSLHRFASTRLTEGERSVLEELVYTADQARLLNKIIRMSDKSVPARPGETTSEGKPQLERKLQTLLNNPNIRNDHVLRKEAEELATRIASM